MQPTLHCTAIGNPALPAILFLHGFLGSGSDWLPFATRLSSDYRCIMADLPGHGRSSILEQCPSGYFMQTIKALAETLQENTAAPATLVGYSMGGRIGLGLAMHYPELLSAAVIVSSSPGLRTEEERAARRKSDHGIARKIERNFDDFIEAWYQQPLFSTLKAHPLFREVEAMRKEGSPEGLALALRLLGTGNQPSLWDKLAGNHVPTLFMAGEKDAKYVEIGHQMVNLHPLSSLEIFPSTGHALHIEDRESFLGRLHDFLNQHHTP